METLSRKNESGMALITAVILLLVLFVLGTALLILGHTEFRISKSFSSNSKGLYVADSGIQHVVAEQNDTTQVPRYLFDAANYQSVGADPYLVDYTLTDPATGEAIGRSTRQIVDGKNPLVDYPPYRIRSTAVTLEATRIVEADIAPLSLLQYAVFSEDDVNIAPYITISGKMYSARTITLTGPNIVFNRDVEYVGSLVNQNYGTYNGQIVHLSTPWPALTTLADLNFFEQASKEAGQCGSGIGLYIGPDSGAKNNALFTRSSGVYQIDLTLFDFSGAFADPQTAVTYNGTQLIQYDTNQPLTDFSGVIFVDGELHIWGIDGGRSVEDYANLDRNKPLASSNWYPGPNGAGNNLYSNNRLDAGEDGSNGGQANGILDPAKKGISLTVVTAGGNDIYIEHNIFMGRSPEDAPVNTALISGDAIYINANSPKTIFIEAALLALSGDSGYSWYPQGSASTHQDNYWAKSSAGSYIFDLDHDGTLEADNGQGQSTDRNELSMLGAWSLIQFGNLITAQTPVSGIWASGGHIRIYEYNPSLLIAEPPCYPVIPIYDVVPGTWVELQ